MPLLRSRLLALPFLVVAAPLQAGSAPLAAPDLAPVVEATRKTFDVPGIAVAVVKDGEVVLAEGYGLREAGKPEKVTTDTRFAIASITAQTAPVSSLPYPCAIAAL